MYAQALINAGATYGMQKFEDLSVSRKTLSTTVMESEYSRIKAELKEKLASQHLSFTTDMWTDTYTQKSFLSISAHYLCEEYNLNVAILGVKEFIDEKKTGANILEQVLCILDDYNLKEKLLNGVMVTDNGANVVSAFSHYKRLSCACHNINLVMDDVFEKKPISELSELIEASKKLVKYFKHSELNKKLTKSLKQHIKTRWNSVYTMLQSIFDVQSEIKSLLLNKDELNRISKIDFDLLSKLLDFLKLFKECSEKLSSEKTPTIHIYVLWYDKLKNHCKQKMLDSSIILQLKAETLQSIEKRLSPTDIHFVGLFFNPPFKQLNFLSSEQKDQVLSTIKAIIGEYCMDTIKKKYDNNDSPNENQDFAEYRDEHNSKKMKLEKSDVEIEIENYYNSSNENENDVLKFWKCANNLKILQKLAKQVLNIPVSSATSERVFSTSGLILSERRTRLLSTNLDKLLFLHKNM